MNQRHEDAIAACVHTEPSYVTIKDETIKEEKIENNDIIREEHLENSEILQSQKEVEKEVVEVSNQVVEEMTVQMEVLDDEEGNGIKEVVGTSASESNNVVESEAGGMDTDVQTSLTDSVPITVSAITPTAETTTVAATEITAATTAETTTAVTAATAPLLSAAVVAVAVQKDELPIRTKPATPSVLLCPMVRTLSYVRLSPFSSSPLSHY